MAKASSLKNIIGRGVSSNVGVFILFAIAVFLCYFLILDTPFKTMDDYLSIVDNPVIKSLGNIPQIFKSSFFSKGTYWRPLVHLSFALEYKFFALDAFYYYLDNIVLHVLASFAVFLLVGKLLKNRMVGIWTGLLFAVHPVHWEQVTNVPGRSILLCGAFFFYSFWMFLKAVDSGRMRDVFFSLVLYILSLLSKESAVILPICVVAYFQIILSQEGRSKEQKGNSGFIIKSFLIITSLYFIFREMLGISGGFQWINLEHTLLSIITFLKALVIYLKLAIMPTGLFYDRSLDIFNSFLEVQIVSTLVFWSITAYFIAKKWSSLSSAVKFLLAWTMINFLTVSQIVPVKVGFFSISTAEHFLYLPSVAIFSLMIILMSRATKALVDGKKVGKGVIVAAACGLYLFYISITINQVIISSNQITMFKQSFERNPKNIRVITPLALAYAYAEMYDEAEKYYKESLKVDPGSVRGLIGAGRALCDQGKYWEGLDHYNKVADAGEFEKMLAHNKQDAYVQMEEMYRSDLSIPRGRVTEELEKIKLAETHNGLGMVYSLTSRMDKAILEYKRAVTIRQKFFNAWMNLAAAYDEIGDRERAIQTYEHIISTVYLDEGRLKDVSTKLRELRGRKSRDIVDPQNFRDALKTFQNQYDKNINKF